MHTDKLSTILGRPITIATLPATLRYPPGTLRREGIKGALGALVCFATLAGLAPAPVIAWPLGIIGVLFVAYLGQQWRRRTLRAEVDSDGVTAGSGDRKRLRWADLEGLRLNFYPNGRRSLQGTLVLTLRRGSTRIKLDSTLEHFPTLLLHAAAAAREGNLEPDPTTEANLQQLGL